MTKPVLVVGSTNRKKCGEILELLDIDCLELKTLADFRSAPAVLEDGTTFVENATKKAVAFADFLGCWVLAEDSGLAVDALGGDPGVWSARYAGEPCDDERNNDKLLAQLAGVPDAARTARYHCAVVVVDPTGTVRAQAEGTCEGRIALERRGENGFGYDPLFLLPSAERTFGELPPQYKRTHSHRAAALRHLRPRIIDLISHRAFE